MYFRPFSFKRGLFFPWQKPGFLGLPQLRKARPFRFREPRGGTREAMGGTATFMKFRIGNRPSFQKLSKTHIFQKTPRVFSHSKSFFFGKKETICVLQEFERRKIRHRCNGAMVGEEFDKENLPQFWRLQQKIQMRNGPGNKFVCL